jgi:hypothetical protein
VLALVDQFCSAARLRIEEKFRALGRNVDLPGYRLCQDVLEGKFDWLESGTVGA